MRSQRLRDLRPGAIPDRLMASLDKLRDRYRTAKKPEAVCRGSGRLPRTDGSCDACSAKSVAEMKPTYLGGGWTLARSHPPEE